MKEEETKNKPPTLLEKVKRRQKLRKILDNRWFLPLTYVTTSLLAFGLIFAYQTIDFEAPVTQDLGMRGDILKKDTTDEDKMIMPINKASGVINTMGFYERGNSNDTGSSSALVHYENSYWPHGGIDFAHPSGTSFEVLSVLEGKVMFVEENPIVGKQVEVKHGNGMVTIYQSLGNIQVKEGQNISKGEVIGTAGRNRFEKAEGVHLHFELLDSKRRNVDPGKYLDLGN